MQFLIQFVPKFTVVIGNSYGAGNYAMCGKAYDPRLIFSLAKCRISGNGWCSSCKSIVANRSSFLESKRRRNHTRKEAELFDKIKARYDQQVSPYYYAAARLWTDAIIDPLDTRTWISMGIEAANHAPIEKPFNLGVIQV